MPDGFSYYTWFRGSIPGQGRNLDRDFCFMHTPKPRHRNQKWYLCWSQAQTQKEGWWWHHHKKNKMTEIDSYAIIQSFNHSGDLCSASLRLLLRGAPSHGQRRRTSERCKI